MAPSPSTPSSTPTNAGTSADSSVHQGELDARGKRTTPWAWVPTLNFASGVPNIVASVLAAAMYKKMGVPDEINTLWTGLLYLPWVIKPLWGPLVDRYATKRQWTLWMQIALAISYAGIAASLFHTSLFFTISLCFFAMMAFFSATHDIACDGFYMMGLNEKQQTWFVGVRSTFYRISTLIAKGIFPALIGWVEMHSGLQPVPLQISASPTVVVQPADRQPSAEFLAISGGAQRIIWETDKLAIPVGGKPASFFVKVPVAPEPGRDIVVSTIYKDGNQNIQLRGGEILRFTSENWKTPQKVSFATDKNVSTETQAEFQAIAGNIPLSWAAVFTLCFAVYLAFYFYHTAMFPYPVADTAQIATDRTPFFQAAGWLFVAVGGTAIIVSVFFSLMNNLFLPPATKEPTGAFAVLSKIFSAGSSFGENLKQGFNEFVQKTFTPEVRERLMKKDLAYTFFAIVCRLIVVLGVGALLLIVKPTRDAIFSFYRSCSRRSGIEFHEVFSSFFNRKNIGILLTFLLIYRMPEGFLNSQAKLFFIEEHSKGGLTLTLADMGFVYGIVGTVGLIAGGILGGLAISRWGLKTMIWPMAIIMHTPNALFLYLAYDQPHYHTPHGFWITNIFVGIEQFGYGFGFAAYMVYMLYMSQGAHKTAHYALATGFMALSMMIPNMSSGTLVALMGYVNFFWLVLFMAVPSIAVLPFLPLDRDFGKGAPKGK